MKSCLVILSSLSQLSLFVFLLLIIDFHFKFTTCNWAAAAALLSSSCTYLLGILSTARKYIFICFVFFGLRWLWKLAQVGLPFWSWDREKETEGGREGVRHQKWENVFLYGMDIWACNCLWMLWGRAKQHEGKKVNLLFIFRFDWEGLKKEEGGSSTFWDKLLSLF